MHSTRRILLLARGLDAGGSERQLAETAKALHRRTGWEVHVGCFHDTGLRGAELRASGIPVVRLPVTSFASISVLNGLVHFSRYAIRNRIALVHAFDVPSTIFSTFAARLSARRIVLSSQRAHRELVTPRDRMLLRVTDKLVNGSVVNCEAMRRHLVTDEGVPPGRVHVCYNGVNTDVFFPAPLPRPVALGDGSVVIGVVAVLRPEKGLPTLVEAFARVHRECPRTRLLIVGSGPLRQPLEDLSHTLGVASNVHFQPATADVPVWLNCMDIFVLPSLSEALSNSLMEAMACGVAPIASSVGGNPELVREAETGLLFEPGDAVGLATQLRRLVDGEGLRRQYAAAAAAFIRRGMTIEHAAARMESIYSQFLPA
jgi:glycosyltransferase involved in cell wall biosynthesis